MRRFIGTNALIVFGVLAAGLPWPGPATPAADERASGAQVYRDQCARCHGPQGEGTQAHYPDPLTGERSVAELTEFIARSMPSDREQKCPPEEARLVAGYVFEAFYSPEARARLAVPRLELNHLTANRYRHAVADLMASFRGWTGPWDEQRGLEASYNAIALNGDGRHVMTRLDPEIKFDFGKGSPDPEQIPPRFFSISWRGSIRAPVTGDYEFIVRSENSFQLWVNDRVTPLIDQWVRSGDEKEFRGVVRLLGGRGYPFLMNFSKMGRGVNKPPEQLEKEEIAPASISLSWIAPGRAEQTVPAAVLSPHHFPETYVVTTPFPPDDRSTGFERGRALSREWDQATTSAALEVADYMIPRLRDLTGGAEPGPEYEQRLRAFCGQFAERAFRRPLDDGQKALYIDRQFAEGADPEGAAQKVVLLVLKSPRFLYQGLGDPPFDGYAAASRLAFALWDATPDAPLLAAAAEGRLSNREQLGEQARRMAQDPRFRHKLREFLLQWMKLDQVRELSKSPEQFAGFDEATARDLRVSLELFLEELIAADDCDFRKLFLSDQVYLNGRLSKLYGGGLAADAPYQRLALDEGRRAGVLTHPYLMSVFADATTTSPIRRGVFVARGVLGRALLPPPDAFTPLAPSLHPGLSTRERVSLQTQAETCQACHALINPLGFPLETFDAIGRFRLEEAGRPVDATGEYASRRGNTAKFNGPRDLAAYLAHSDEAHVAFVDKLFHFAIQQSPRAYGPETTAHLKQRFVDAQFNMRTLLIEIALTAALGPPAARSP